MPSPELPYPSSTPERREATISYTLKEVIDQINRKLDVLPALISQVQTLDSKASAQTARMEAVEIRLDTLEDNLVKDLAVQGFRDKAFGKLVALAGIAGIIAGITVQIISSI